MHVDSDLVTQHFIVLLPYRETTRRHFYFRELADMMSATEGGHGKADVVRAVA